MKTKLNYMAVMLICLSITVCGYSCDKKLPITEPILTDTIKNNFEVSYWIDIDLRTNNYRGYWINVAEINPDSLATEQQIINACYMMRNMYKANKLYVIYHRQFEIDDAKKLFQFWQNKGKNRGMTIVPCIMLESYSTQSTLNFTNDEIVSLASWCTNNINSKEFSIYDTAPRQDIGSVQDKQLVLIKNQIGNKIVHVGLQPGVKINQNFLSGVEDTWTAECQGLTNEYWENPLSYKGTTNYGRKLLESWVKERINNDSCRIVWDMIPVAWDYDAPVDPLGYICPGDYPFKNDPPVPGRIDLCDKYIEKLYENGVKNPKFGGYSCDLHILEVNSFGKPESPTFYEQIRERQPYTGRYAGTMSEISQLFDKFDGD